MAIWPTAVATDADLYVAKNALQTTLSTALGTGDTTVVLASATGFPVAGAVVIGNEVIFYTNISGASLTGCTRGADGTTAATHSVGVPVGAAVVACHHNLLKDEIEAIETFLNTHLGKSTAVTAAEFEYVHGVTSAIQTQLDAKAALALSNLASVAINTALLPGADNTIDLGDATHDFRSLYVKTSIKNGATTLATVTELGYLTGVSSAIQTQFTGKASTDLSNVASVSANVPMNSKKFTGLAAGSANGDSVRFEQLNPGKILQIVAASSTSVFATTSSTFSSTNSAITITPQSATSQILIFVSTAMGCGSTASVAEAAIFRGSTNISIGGIGASYLPSASSSSHVPVTMCIIDSPATTSATTYTVKLLSSNNSASVSWGATSGQIMYAMEIGQ